LRCWIYDVPPPPSDEVIYVDRPVLYFGDPDFGLCRHRRRGVLSAAAAPDSSCWRRRS